VTAVLVLAARAGSGAASLGTEFCRRTGAQADLVYTGGGALPPGAWRQAWCPGALSGIQASEAVQQAMCAADYSLVLFDEGEGGREAAARVAVRLGLPVVAQVASVRADSTGLRLTRIVEGGARTAVIAPRGPVTLAVISGSVGGGGGEAGTARERSVLHLPPAAHLLDVISEYQPPPGEIELDQADVVVAGGRGIGGREGFAQLEELAGLLGGTVGASRVAVDAGWVPYRRQVGLTGKTVSPRLYLALGISGAPHHVLGMRNSSLIVAVNSDPQAPIFRLAHVSIVAKVEDVVPQLIDELRRRKDARTLVGAR
jgi:electron transfer flavoprotein alpha subunit